MNVELEFLKALKKSNGKKGICFSCRYFDAKEWVRSRGAAGGARACKSAGIATEGKIACSAFEKIEEIP
jgi:hypothetical protein